MKSRILVVALLSVLAAPAFAGDAAAHAAKEMIPLNNGGTLYFFKDGRMAQEDCFGRAVHQKIGSSVVTKDGLMVTITSNEVAPLSSLLEQDHGGSFTRSADASQWRQKEVPAPVRFG